MDVILLRDVERLGTAGQVVQVKNGYARNYLLPTGRAAAASAGALARVQDAQRQQQRRTQRAQDDAQALKQRLEAVSLTLTLTLGADERAFGSVTAHEIAEALRAQGLAIEKQALHLEEPIKALGVYEVPVRLTPQVSATVKVQVVKA